MTARLGHRTLAAVLGLVAMGLAASAGPAGAISSLVKAKQKNFDGSVTASRYGAAVAAIGDVDGDGIGDLAVGMPNRSLSAGPVYTGGVWILFMRANGTVRATSFVGAGLALRDDDEFGASVTGIGDVNGDGVPDIAVGAPGDDDKAGTAAGGLDRGAVWIVLLRHDGTTLNSYKLSAFTDANLNFPDDFERFGASLASLGDLDGVGGSQLALAAGAPGDRDGNPGVVSLRGAVDVLFMSWDGVLNKPVINNVQKISQTQGVPAGFLLHDGDLFGCSVAACGDLNGDGVTDLAVGAPLDDDNTDGEAGPGANRGAVYVLLMNSNGTAAMPQKISATAGGFSAHLAASDLFGDAVAGLPDLDQNGVRDLAIGSSGRDEGADGTGAVWIMLLNRNPGTGAITVKQQLEISNAHGNFGSGLVADDAFGIAAASIGDLNGDGFPDLAAGAPGDGVSPTGAFWVLDLGRSLVSLVSSVNPSVVDQAVTFTATVTPGTGTVEFFDVLSSLGVRTVSGGQAALATNQLTAGVHPIKGIYSGDAENIGGPSPVVNQEVDAVVATLLSLFQANPTADGIELSWRFGDPAQFVAADLQRAESASGPWTVVAADRQDVGGNTVTTDRGVVAGRAYFYQLVATTTAGQVLTFGPLSATAGVPVTAFELGPGVPNPSTGPVRIDFAVPRESRLRLSVLDVQGREVAKLAEGVYPPGRYQANWTGQVERGRATAGVFFVRYQTPDKTLVRRVVLAR